MRILLCTTACCLALFSNAQLPPGYPVLAQVSPLKDLSLPSSTRQVATPFYHPQSCLISCRPLPVKWLSIKGERKSDSTCLVSWQTTAESMNMGFDVERSEGSSNNFYKVGFVPAGNSNNPLVDYTFRDANDFTGTSFYRLRQIDADNRFNYSKVVAVKGYSKVENLELYPNPAVADLQLSMFLSKGGVVRLLLYNASGQVLQQRTQPFTKGGNVVVWDVAHLAAGSYFIRAVTPAGATLPASFMKQ